MGAVLGLEHERLSDLGVEHALETGDHIGLGHPADAAEFTVGGGSLVGGERSGEVREVATLLEDGHQAVSSMGGVLVLKQDMLDERGVRKHLAVHHAGGVEGVAVVDDLGHGGAAEDLVVQLSVDCAQLSGLVPVVVQAAVGILEQEGTHVVRGGELVVGLGNRIAGGSDVGLGRNDLIHNVFDIAVGVLLEEILVGLVVGADLVGRHVHGAVLGGHRVVHHDVVHICGRVAVLEGLGELQGVVHSAGGEQGAVFGVELLVVDRVLDVVPVGAELAALVAVDILDEGLQAVGGEGAGLIHEHRVLLDDRGDILAAHQGQHLVLADGQAGILGILDEHVLVQELLPRGVADLLLGLLVADGPGEELVDGRVTVDVGLEVRVGHPLACNLADVVFGRHRVECRLQRVRVNDKGKEGQRDDNRDQQAKLNAYFFKYRHSYVIL